MCSMPQKHPAARVAFCAPSGMVMLLAPVVSGLKCMVEEEKGRMRRWRSEPMVYAVSRPVKRRAIWVVGLMLGG